MGIFEKVVFQLHSSMNYNDSIDQVHDHHNTSIMTWAPKMLVRPCGMRIPTWTIETVDRTYNY